MICSTTRLAAAAFAAGAGLALAPAAAAHATGTEPACNDFPTRLAAQQYYDTHGKNLPGFDNNGNGIVCEHRFPPTLVVSSDKDCADFPSQAAAQAYFLSKGGSKTNNVDNLDANHNGIACESYHYPPVIPSPSHVPSPSPAGSPSPKPSASESPAAPASPPAPASPSPAVPVTPGQPQLPITGAATTVMAFTGAAMMLTGIGAVLWSRRSRRAGATGR
jgi:LPXTG-motif cell wall-anchored protein